VNEINEKKMQMKVWMKRINTFKEMSVVETSKYD